MTAPDFVLKDLDGSAITLSKEKGKVVFLEFWASWCPPCRKSIPAVERLSRKFKDSNVVFLGINLESNTEKIKKFVKRNGMTYRVMLDTDDVAEKYGVSGVPSFFIINPKGEIIKSYSGFDPGMEDEWEKLISESVPASKPLKSPKSINNVK